MATPEQQTSILELPFTYSTVRNWNDKAPRRVTSTWGEFITTLVEPDIRGELPLEDYLQLSKDAKHQQKDGHAIFACTFGQDRNSNDNLRHKANARAMHSFIGDADSVSRDVIENGLNGLTYALYSSYSNHPNDPRYRFIVAYCKPMSPKFQEAAVAYFQDLLGIKIDPCCKNPACLFYTPATPPGGEQYYEYVSQAGKIFDPTVFESKAAVATSPKVEVTAPTELPTYDISELPLSPTIKALIRDGQPEGKRSEAVFKCICAMVKANIADDLICAILTDPANNISAKALSERRGDRKSAAEWVARQIPKAKQSVNTQKQHIDNSPNVVNFPTPLKVVTLAELLAQDIVERENILAPWLPVQGLAMIYAGRGVGKTQIALDIAYAVASGIKLFNKWEVGTPRGVIYLDGEMPLRLLQERLAAIVAAAHIEPSAPLEFITPDLQDSGMPDLATPAGQAAINASIGDDIELIIVDNLSTLAPSAKENENDSWVPLQTWALQHRAKGRTVLFIHHGGKGGQQRGNSRKEDVLDTVIALRRPDDYNPKDGAVFQIHFEKARGFHGDDSAPFEARLISDDKNARSWSTRSVEQSTLDKVASLLKDGLSANDIAQETGLPRSTVYHNVKKAKEAGLASGD